MTSRHHNLTTTPWPHMISRHHNITTALPPHDMISRHHNLITTPWPHGMISRHHNLITPWPHDMISRHHNLTTIPWTHGTIISLRHHDLRTWSHYDTMTSRHHDLTTSRPHSHDLTSDINTLSLQSPPPFPVPNWNLATNIRSGSTPKRTDRLTDCLYRVFHRNLLDAVQRQWRTECAGKLASCVHFLSCLH